MIVPTKTNNVI